MSASEVPHVLLIVRCCIVNSENEILLLKRSSQDRYRSGEWEFPGGKVEQGEEISIALQVEIKEETGLELQVCTNFMHTESRVIESGPYQGKLYLGLCGVVVSEITSVTLSPEHDDFIFRPAQEIGNKQREITPETADALQVLLEAGQVPTD